MVAPVVTGGELASTDVLPLCEGQILGQVVRHLRAARRLRLLVPGLVGHRDMARQIEREVAAEAGVVRVAADPVSGRISIDYAQGAALLGRIEPRVAPRSRPGSRSGSRWRGRPKRRLLEPGDRAWHAARVEEVLAGLSSAAGGLSTEEARRRLVRFGRNEPDPFEPRPHWSILFEQVANLPSALLVGAAGASLVLGDVVEAGAILLVVGMNAVIGYRIERRSEDLLSSSRRFEEGAARVARAGKVFEVAATSLVPGDVILCRAGDMVPADARVIEALGLSCDEAPLTGESEPRAKGTQPVADGAPLAERDSMIFAGTTVASGQGRAVLVATGEATEMALVRALLQAERPPPAPLEERLRRLVRRTSEIGLAAGALAATAGVLRRQPVAAVLRGSVALAVAAIPEGLPVTSTAALVRAMQRMERRGVVARRVASAEALGSVTVVCADKTGTLTRNEMAVACLATPDGTFAAAELAVGSAEPLAAGVPRALSAVVLSCEIDFSARGDAGRTSLASATERALVAAASQAGLDPVALAERYPRRLIRERQDGRHYVVAVHGAPDGGALAFVKGAPEQVIDLCDSWAGAPLDPRVRDQVLAQNRAFASGGLRVLAVAWRRYRDGLAELPEDRFELLGLVGLRDPTRRSAAAAVAGAAGAGIRTLILTGDQNATAAAVARETGLGGEVVDGAELASALERGEPGARARLRRVAALSRVTPAEKLVVVRALRAMGEVVAMAGDGINDAPALRAADVGVAVGARASDMARRTADVVLEGDDLCALLAAVGEGRTVHDNLRRATRFLLATNLSEVLLALAGAVIGRQALTPMQLLWINLLTDTAPAIALVLERGEEDLMQRAPPGRSLGLMAPADWRAVARDGALMAALGQAALVVGGPGAAFAGLTGAQITYAARCRASGAPASRRFVAAVGGAAALQLAAVSVAPLRSILGSGGPAALVALAVGLCAPLLAGETGDEIVFRPALVSSGSPRRGAPPPSLRNRGS